MQNKTRKFSIRFSLASVIIPAIVCATPASAQSRQQLLFEWQGRVDKEIRVEMRGTRATVDLIGDKETGRGRVRNVGQLPNADEDISVQMVEGRGKVDIVQQPSRQNGYTAIVRIRDTQSGASNYRVRAYTTVSARDNRRNTARRDDNRGRSNHDGNWDHRY